ncbi:hypothetical protein B4589_009900 [Halolamina sp. CBA1230]|uniref:hypothetical protein n=1 Tax=Halolamina sp. CBA1230 TaxID=1853690 RepID=UPI001301F371|nr:hypothetical protein [Halolamina sp. CBA1230]QKY20676.1 hypothetical protein B4589_009900 [Halolamina sp. CBA1230]
MVTLDETTIGMAFAVVGVVATLIWYGLAWYGIATLRDIRDALGSSGADGR